MAKEQKPFVQALEDEATLQLDAIAEARAYKGNNPDYHKRAKMAIGVIGAYVRLRATLANEKSNDLIERRMLVQEEQAQGARLRLGAVR